MALNISSDLVPQVINDYNAYTEDDLLIGLADEITLPKIKNKTTSVSGMGIAGEVDSPVPGQFESMEATLNWNTMYSYATKMMNPNKNIQITLRAAMQNDNKNGGYTYKGLRVVLGGRPKELDPGKLKRADTMGSTTTLEVTRYLMEQGLRPSACQAAFQSRFPPAPVPAALPPASGRFSPHFSGLSAS